MTRYALCATTHTLAALKLGLPHAQAYAAGVAIATAIAVFKNRRLGGGSGGGKQRKWYPNKETSEPQQTTTSHHPLPTIKVGGFDLLFEVSPLGQVVARVVLGGEVTELKGTSVRGEHEFNKIPPEVREQLWELLQGVDAASRKVFDVYKTLRDTLAL